VKDFALSDRVLPLDVRVNPRARRLVLRLERGGKSLRISVPVGTTEQQITDFLEKSQNWLEKKLEKFPSFPKGERMLREGVKIPYLGQPHLIVHRPGRGTTHLLTSPQGESQIIITGQAAYLPRHLADFLKKQARNTIVPLVATYTTRLGVQAKSIHFKDTSSRWGSCSHVGRLSFSWRIMMAPQPVVRYLVAHEVAHLLEMNHGKGFWQICTDLCPQTQACRSWLKRNGHLLQAIDFT